MIKQLFILTLLFVTVIACNKNQELAETQQTLTKSNQADVLYHYKGQAYPLYFEESSTEDFIQDENFTALQQATAQSTIVTFVYSNQPENHIYLFDNEMEGYDYLEKNNNNPLIGRKFKLSYRIDELRTALTQQFGEVLDFKNPAVAAAAQQGIAALYQELHLNVPMPADLEAFIGIKNTNFSRQKTGNGISSNPVFTVWSDIDAQGSEMYVEQAPNTVIWNYGNNNCFTMAANPDLTLEFQANGNNWNDCISSQCLSYIQGADAMGIGLYKDSHFGVYNNGFLVMIYIANPPAINSPAIYPTCINHTSYNWFHPNGWGGHMNDQISSIRVKAIWQGCYLDDSVFNDLLNK